jgi:hypothetical protein
LALNATRDWQVDPQHNLYPIWLDLAHWKKGSLKRFIQRESGLTRRTFKELNLAVYLDGFDRLTPHQVAEVREWLNQPTDRPVRAIGTCRTTAFSALRLPMDTVTLADALTNAQSDRFIRNYLGAQSEPLRSILLLDTLTPEQMKPINDRFPQAKDPALLLRVLTAKPIEADSLFAMAPDQVLVENPDNPIPNPYRDIIDRPDLLASLLLNYQAFPALATPFNVGAVVHTILTHIWQRHSDEFPSEVPSWGDAVRLSASLADSMRSQHWHDAVQDPVPFVDVVRHNRSWRTRASQVRRLADHLVLAGIWHFNATDGTVCFTSHLFFEYFLAQSIDPTSLQGSFSVPYNDLWNRYYQDWDTVVIGLCALTENPTVLLEMLLKRDTVLAAKCLISLDWGMVPRPLHARIVDDVESLMLDPQNARAGEDRAVEAAILLFLLSDASAIPKMIEAMKLVQIDRFVERIASLIERFGVLALPALHSYLDVLEPRQDSFDSTFKHVVRTLARIRSQDSVKSLASILPKLQSVEQPAYHYDEILVRAALVQLGETAHKDIIFQRILLSPDDQGSWNAIADISMEFIPDLVFVLTTAAEYPRQYRFNAVTQNFLKTMKYRYGIKAYPYLKMELARTQQLAVRTVLLDTLGQLGEKADGAFVIDFLQDRDPYVKRYAIEAAGRLRVTEAVPHLISLLNDTDVTFRYEAAGALGQIGDASAVHALRARLTDCADASTHPQIRSLRVCDAAANALVSIGTSESKQIALAWCEEIIDKQPLQNAYNRTFDLLVRIDTPRAFELWNKLHYRLYPSE